MNRFLLIIVFSVKTWHLAGQGNLAVSFQGDFYPWKNPSMGNGFRMSTFIPLVSDINYLKVNAAFTFGAGSNFEFTSAYRDRAGDTTYIADYKSAHLEWSFIFTHFARGSLDSGGVYIGGGIGYQAFEISARNIPNEMRLDLKTTSKKLRSVGATITAGFVVPVYELRFFGELGLTAPFGNWSSTVFPASPLYLSLSLGIIFEVSEIYRRF